MLKISNPSLAQKLALLAIVCFFSRILWIFFIAENMPNALGGANWYLNPFPEPIPPGGYVSPDFNQVYDPNARMLSEGKGFSNLDGTPTAYVAPGYSFLISIIYSIFGINIDYIRIAQAIIDSISAVMVYFLAYKILKSEVVSFLSSAFFIFFPSFIYQSGLLITENLFTLVLILYFYFSFIALEKKKYNMRLYLMSGIMLGIASLVRPNAIILASSFFLPIIFNRMGYRVSLINFMVYLLGLFAVVGPWIIRNYIHFDQFIPISSIVFNTVEDTTGSAANILDLLYKKFYVIFTDLDYLVNFYLFAPIRIWAQTGSGTYDIYVGIIHYPVLLASFLGLLKACKINKNLSIYTFISVLIFVIALIFFTKNSLTRYVVPIMPCIIIFAVYYVHNLFISLKNKNEKNRYI